MNFAVRTRIPLAPLAAVAATGALLVPVSVGTPTPQALAEALANRADHSATALLAAVNPLAAAVPPEVQAAAFAEILGGLGDIVTLFGESLLGSPINVVEGLGSLLTGQINLAVVNIGSILTDPLLESQVALDRITGGLADLFPDNAPGFEAIGGDNIVLPALSLIAPLFGGIGPGLQAIYDGVTAGLLAGDVVAAFTGFVDGVTTLIANTSEAITGAETGFGIIPAFTEYFQIVAAAFAQTPPTAALQSVTELPAAAVPPAPVEQTATQLVTVAIESAPSAGADDASDPAAGAGGTDAPPSNDATAGSTDSAEDAAAESGASEDGAADGETTGSGGSTVRHSGSGTEADAGTSGPSGTTGGSGSGSEAADDADASSPTGDAASSGGSDQSAGGSSSDGAAA